MPDPLRGFDHDGFHFEVSDHGPSDGPVIIALHGFPQTGRSFDAVIPKLTAAGYRVLAPDQRGYSPGARPPEAAAYRIDRLAGDVLALADAAGAGTFHLLGHDWGGGVGWFLAAHRPDRVQSLSVASTPHPRALMAAMARGQWLKSWYMAWFQLPRLPEWMLGLRHGALARRVARDIPSPETVISLLGDPAAARATLNWYRAMRIPGAPPPGRVAVPTSYVWGAHDPYLGRAAALGSADWVSADYRFVELPYADHWLPERQPDELAALVLDRVGG